MDGNRQPCKFFQQGQCKFGDKCAFSHQSTRYASSSNPQSSRRHNDSPNTRSNSAPLPETHRSGKINYRPKHKQSPLKSEENSARPGRAGYKPKNEGVAKAKKGGRKNYQSPPPRLPNNTSTNSSYRSKNNHNFQKQQHNHHGNSITPDQVIIHDLSTITTQWPFTCYGIVTDFSIAKNILGGFDYSPEELRLQALMDWKATGSINSYIHQVELMKSEIENQRKRIINDPTGAINASLVNHHASSAVNGNFSAPAIQNIPNFTNNLTSNNQAAFGDMQDDTMGTFELGSVPLEPPSK